MSRIRLLDVAPTMTFDFVMESADNAIEEFEAMAKQNAEMQVIEITEDEATLVNGLDQHLNDLEESLIVTRQGLNSINAMNDTSMLIAPSIKESTKKDLALVRQIANTAGMGMGLDPGTLLPRNFDDTVGKPMSLNMEGFKEKSIAAIKAVWRFILKIFDYAMSIFKSTFGLIPQRLKALKNTLEAFKNESKGKQISGTIKGNTSWSVLSAIGGFPRTKEDISKTTDNIGNLTDQFARDWRWDMLDVSRMTDKDSLEKVRDTVADRVALRVEEFAERKGHAIVRGQDLVSQWMVGGGMVVIRKGNSILDHYRRNADALAKEVVGSQMEWVMETSNNPSSAEAALPALQPQELIDVCGAYLALFDKKLTAKVIVDADTNSKIDKRKADDFATKYDRMLDKASDIEVAYITEIAGMLRAVTTYKYSAFAQFMRTVTDTISAMDGYVDAHRKLLTSE